MAIDLDQVQNQVDFIMWYNQVFSEHNSNIRQIIIDEEMVSVAAGFIFFEKKKVYKKNKDARIKKLEAHDQNSYAWVVQILIDKDYASKNAASHDINPQKDLVIKILGALEQLAMVN